MTTTTKRPTTSTTTPKPTTTPTTTTKTTTKPTSVIRTTQGRVTRQSTINDRADGLPALSVGSWVLDREVVLWVLKLRDGKFMISKPGERPTKYTRGEYINMRRQILGQSATTPAPIRQQNRQSNPRPIAQDDDPFVSLDNSPSRTLVNVPEGGNTNQGNNVNERIGTSSVNTGLPSGFHAHRHGHGNRADNRHKVLYNDKNFPRETTKMMDTRPFSFIALICLFILKLHGSLHVLKFIACIHILHTPIYIYNLSMSKLKIAEQSFRCFVRKKKVENSQIYFIFTEKSSL